MKKLVLILLCLPLLFTTCKKEEENTIPNSTSPTWKKTFSGYAYSVQKTSDGGYIIAGEVNHPNSGGNSYLIKTNLNGNIIWTKDSGYSGEFLSIDQTTDGGYILTGNTWGSGQQRNFLLMKIDSNGNEQWSASYSNPSNTLSGISVQQTTDGGYIFFTTKGLVKTASNGNETWSSDFNGINSDYRIYDGEQTSDGGYVCTGILDTGLLSTTNENVFLSKFNSNGNQQWEKTWDFGNQKDEYGYEVEQTVDGGYIIGAYADSDPCKLIKTDSNGNEIWRYNFISSDDGGFSVNQTLDGGYIIANSDDSGKIFLIKIDSQGNSIWNTTTYSLDFSNVARIYQTTDLGFIILGNTGDSNDWYQGETDIILIKTNPQGNY
jgi:hypothetical protein